MQIGSFLVPEGTELSSPLVASALKLLGRGRRIIGEPWIEREMPERQARMIRVHLTDA